MLSNVKKIILIFVFLISLSFVYAEAQIIFTPDNQYEPGEVLSVTFVPERNFGIFKYVYIYDNNDVLQDIIVLNGCEGFICYKRIKASFTIPLSWHGDYYMAVYDYSINDYVIGNFIVGSGEFFDRKLNCNGCRDHKAPSLTDVEMSITAGGYSGNIDLADYFEKDWSVVDANGGVVSNFDSKFDKITWNVDIVGSVTKTYTIRSPAETLPNSKYIFYTELLSRSNDWDVIVADDNIVEELLPIFHLNTKLGSQLSQQQVDLIKDDDDLYLEVKSNSNLESELEDLALNPDIINNAYCDLFYYSDAGFTRNVVFEVYDMKRGLLIDSIIVPESTTENFIRLSDLQNKGLNIGNVNTLFIRIVNNEKGKQGKSVYVEKISCAIDYGVASTLGVGVSDELGKGIKWDIQTLPVNEKDAVGNNDLGDTLYYLDINSEGTNVDVYLRGSGDLIFGTNSIALGNEKVSYSVTDSAVSSTSKNSITTNFIDNKIGNNLVDGTRIYLKFYLSVPGSQAAGDYLNFLEFKAVPSGVAP